MGKPKRIAATPATLGDLSFTTRKSWWAVKGTDDYWADCDRGARLGLEYVASRKTGSGTILQHIVKAMPRDLTGVEIGFLSVVERAAVSVDGLVRARAVVDLHERVGKAYREGKRPSEVPHGR